MATIMRETSAVKNYKTHKTKFVPKKVSGDLKKYPKNHLKWNHLEVIKKEQKR